MFLARFTFSVQKGSWGNANSVPDSFQRQAECSSSFHVCSLVVKNKKKTALRGKTESPHQSSARNRNSDMTFPNMQLSPIGRSDLLTQIHWLHVKRVTCVLLIHHSLPVSKICLHVRYLGRAWSSNKRTPIPHSHVQ